MSPPSNRKDAPREPVFNLQIENFAGDGSLEKWVGEAHRPLTMVFTDVVFSTTIGQKLGDTKWIEEIILHFGQGRDLCNQQGGFVVKVIGDAMLCVFKTTPPAMEFAKQFVRITGSYCIAIRAGIHVGEVCVRENDIYGLNVNLASRIQTSVPFDGIHISDRIRSELIAKQGAESANSFHEIPDLQIKNFPEAKVFRFCDLEHSKTHALNRWQIARVLGTTDFELFYGQLSPGAHVALDYLESKGEISTLSLMIALHDRGSVHELEEHALVARSVSGYQLSGKGTEFCKWRQARKGPAQFFPQLPRQE